MRLMAKNKKRWVAFSAAAIMALGLTLPSTIRAGAYTLDNAATFVGEARTPDSLDAMTRQGFRTEGGMVDPNFENVALNVKPRSEYGGPWSFTHQDELGAPVEEFSSVKQTAVTDAVDGMGEVAGVGDKITTAVEITINKDNQQTLPDSLTYSTFDDMMYGEVAKEAFYFTAWIKAEQDMWFDVGISYGRREGHADVYWDLGRRFFVPANEWTQIGLDEEGNYLPFRTKVLTTGFLRGTGSDPTSENCNSAAADIYAKENIGDTKIEQYYRDSWGGSWACMRLYAYAGSVYEETNGVGAPASNSGLSAGDKYLVTGTNFWNQSAEPYTPVTKVEAVTLDKTTALMKVGEELQLNATVAPENATDKEVIWYSGDETIATVDEDGKVTALKEGSTTITAEANDGNGALATCTLTVTKDEEEPTPSTSDKNSASTGEGNSDKDDASGCGSVVGFGTAGVVTLLAGAAIVSKRKKN